MINLLRQGFTPYMGKYEKVFYDIVLKNKKDRFYQVNDEDRAIIKHCWPNAGYFTAPNGKRYHERKILAFKVSEEQGHETTEK